MRDILSFLHHSFLDVDFVGESGDLQMIQGGVIAQFPYLFIDMFFL